MAKISRIPAVLKVNMQFRFSNLHQIDFSQLIDVFNDSFADYFVKIKLDEKSLSDKILAENITLENSVGAFLDKKLVGFILIGLENRVAYNGGTGVLPEFRGNSLTSKMYEFILPKLTDAGITSHQLEVITENLNAISIYEKIGFKRSRKLLCFKGNISVSEINSKIEIKHLEKIDDELFQSFCNSQPSWQNSLSSIKRSLKLHKIAGAFIQNKLVGYLIYTENGRIKQFAVCKNFRRQNIAQTLLSLIKPNQKIMLTNIDENDYETVSFLKKAGLNPFLEQFELKLSV